MSTSKSTVSASVGALLHFPPPFFHLCFSGGLLPSRLGRKLALFLSLSLSLSCKFYANSGRATEKVIESSCPFKLPSMNRLLISMRCSRCPASVLLAAPSSWRRQRGTTPRPGRKRHISLELTFQPQMRICPSCFGSGRHFPAVCASICCSGASCCGVWGVLTSHLNVAS